MLTSDEKVPELAKALAAAQAAMAGATKSSTNPFFKSKYADLASVWEACRAALTAHGLSVVQSGQTTEHRVTMVTRLLHASGEWLESDALTVEANDAGPQAIGSCLTYLRRYQLAGVVGVAPEDDDAEAAEGRGRSVTLATMSPPAGAHPLNEGQRTTQGPSPALHPEPQPVYIDRVESVATRNPHITKKALTLSDGRVVTTLREGAIGLAMACCNDRTPIIVITRATKWGLDLVDLKRPNGPITDSIDAQARLAADESAF